jgi:hypothetical protein
VISWQQAAINKGISGQSGTRLGSASLGILNRYILNITTPSIIARLQKNLMVI